MHFRQVFKGFGALEVLLDFRFQLVFVFAGLVSDATFVGGCGHRTDCGMNGMELEQGGALLLFHAFVQLV